MQLNHLEEVFNTLQKMKNDLMANPSFDTDEVANIRSAMDEVLLENRPVVMVKTYGKWRAYPNRETAMRFFKECMYGSEGSERDRYVQVLRHLEKGDVFIATDSTM
jgi:hypothetical protein